MKLEMGESLCYSWLRHVKGCQVVQLNWTPAKECDTIIDYQEKEEKLLKLMDVINEKYKELNIFNEENKQRSQIKNSILSQFIKQTECDLVGVKLSANNVTEYITVDVAFHMGGLLYPVSGMTKLNGNKHKLSAKIIRTAFCLYVFMNTKKANIIFATPLISGEKQNAFDELKNLFSEIQKIFKSNGFDYEFSLIANDDFKDLLKDVQKQTQGYTDTSELFLRALQLNEILNKEKKKTNREKIIEFVDWLKQNNKLDENILSKLLNGERNGLSRLFSEKLNSSYNKESFKLNEKTYYVIKSDVEQKLEQWKKFVNYPY